MLESTQSDQAFLIGMSGLHNTGSSSLNTILYIDSGCKIAVTLWKTVSTQVRRRSSESYYLVYVYMRK